jgi:3-phytase
VRQSLNQHPARRIIWWTLCIVAALSTTGSGQVLLAQQETVTPEAKAQTVPVPHPDDAADDPAIWIHPTDPEKSLILGTDKDGGVHAYNMDGSHHQLVSEGTKPNNVDVLYGFKLGGKLVDIAMAGVRAKRGRGAKVWVIDSTSRSLSDVTEGGVFELFGGRAPYGACGYKSAKSGQLYFFVTNDKGRIEQYRLEDAGNGKIKASKVRAFSVRSQAEGCVADDEQGHLYIGEEEVGIWKFGAEPEAGDQGTLVAKVGDHGLKAQVEGLTIYFASDGKGYLIASSQGNHTFKVYTREGDNHFVLTIDPKAGKIDDVSETDGIAVTSCPTSKQFPKGVFIVQDGTNSGGNQNFKLYAWEDIAGAHLIVDPGCSPRAN